MPWRVARTGCCSTAHGAMARWRCPRTRSTGCSLPSPGQRLDGDRLHFNPVPGSIPRGARIRTTIRVRHLDSPDRLADRLAKYELADPGRRGAADAAAREPEAERSSAGRRGRPSSECSRCAEGSGWTTGRAEGASHHLPAAGPQRRGRPRPDSSSRWLASPTPWSPSTTARPTTRPSVLEASPLVERVLRNPARATTRAGTTLPTASVCSTRRSRLAPDWVIFLDADERIDRRRRRGAASLRRTGGVARSRLRVPGLPDVARTQSLRPRGAVGVPAVLAERRPALPDQRLHLVPVPTEIPRERGADDDPHPAPGRG